MSLAPHQFWQTIDAPGAHNDGAQAGWLDGFPAALPDGRQLLLPIRVLPGDGSAAVASLIINQASFAVEDGLSAVMAAMRRFNIGPRLRSSLDISSFLPGSGGWKRLCRKPP